ncbi:YopX family protein [Macrococcus armenti]|uniref:YopX family protein n=1 Tax=Macrococcus armenti TaxID=2875764 RepID=UPI001CCFAB8D|nr:YopX family protein [Macrococcus armenti]UBH14134.1 YopX family protein [Macrococcus armenti]
MIPKFRAWNKYKKKMIEWEDLTISKDADDDELLVWTGGFVSSVIIGAILMQSTGLHDKNGKEIYEGDIVNIQFVVWDFEGETEKEYKNAAIYFDTYGSQLSVPSFYIKDEYGVRLLSELAFYDENIEIIGNIHEHPELLVEDGE